jgi:hypothetical protein
MPTSSAQTLDGASAIHKRSNSGASWITPIPCDETTPGPPPDPVAGPVAGSLSARLGGVVP